MHHMVTSQEKELCNRKERAYLEKRIEFRNVLNETLWQKDHTMILACK